MEIRNYRSVYQRRKIVRFWKIVLVVLVIAVNFVFAPASWAESDKPKYTSNPD